MTSKCQLQTKTFILMKIGFKQNFREKVFIMLTLLILKFYRIKYI